MATKTDISTTEWETLRDAPHAVAMAVTVASGLSGSIKEVLTPTGPLVEALHGENQLLRQICGKEEIKAFIASLKEMAKSSDDFKSIQTFFHKAASGKSQAGLDLLRRKGIPEDIAAFCYFLLKPGEKVANAAIEGAFLRFCGERVSGVE
ncbi:MAG: hypothetical protein PHO08_13225 [Methylococcales bacterium]|nr:hypothetical protein [Methylococcales bacterium]MDD5630570.1 hypothetical protein [Methylococcales bacterium]